MNPSMELLENVLFSIVLNQNTLNSGNVVNSFPAGLQPAPILKQQPKNDRLLLKSYNRF